MSTGFPQSLHVVASALAVGMQVGAIRDGAPAMQFASEFGLGEGDAAAACQLAARRAIASPPDVLVPSASTFARVVAQLDAIRVGAGQRWSAHVLGTARIGLTPMAARLRLLLMTALEGDPPDSSGRSLANPSPSVGESTLPRRHPSQAARGVSGASDAANPAELTFDDGWAEEDESDLLAGDTVSDDLGLVDEDDADESDGAADSADDEIELEDDEEVEDEDDEDSDDDDGPLLTDEAIDDLLADDSVDLDDDWMEDKPAT